MSKLKTPVTLTKYPNLLEDINQTIIDLKVHDEQAPLMTDEYPLTLLREKHTKHSNESLCMLLKRCYNVIKKHSVWPGSVK